ncbi:NAD-dependent epimerase/dehydratase family protein [Candidatus Laterigemmans baculatus]|uniref:NAD-dependent epimerase/dehydratase family protein n=1 Tax=Candidatus Laterigemmans baculatus TaxID=2770505 RepID=UPI0013DD8454|nr:NAD-dependent epimerase/dehydratase family protein [Candidatus Laterigemmans baculatus]
MRAIVTGVAGFIGSHVADRLLARGYRVLGIDDLSGGFRENVPAAVDFEPLSCNAPLDDLFKAYRPDAVFHLAAYAAEGLSHHIPHFNYQNNVLGTVNVLAASQRAAAGHFVFTSSIAVYGHPTGGGAFREADACHPCDPYGIAKLACEQQIRAAHDYFGGPTYTLFRPHNVYGPRQNIADLYRNVVGIFMRCGLQGEPFPIFGDGSQTRSFSYITPVAEAIAAAATEPAAKNQTFNIGGDQPTSVAELATAVAEVLGVERKIATLEPRNEVQHAHADHEKAARVFPEALGESVELREGLQRMAAQVRTAPIPSPTPCPAPIELPARLPPRWQ